jgi:hypothetical protein
MTSEHLDDDALSATLDGEATPDEHAHVEGCAECRARVQELRRAANAIGTPLAAVDPARRDAAIAAALLAQPTLLASRRRQPPGWLLGAAAAVIALGILVPLVNRATGSGDSGADQASSSARSLSKATESQDSAATGAAPLFAAAPPDLGVIASEADLRERVLEALQPPATDVAAPSSTTSAASGASNAADPCEGRLTADDATLGALRLDARATIDGTPGRVLVFEVRDDPATLHALGLTDGCDVLRSATFPAP